MTNAEKLTEAARLVREVAEEMDSAGSVCRGCGCMRYEDWPAHQRAEALEGALTRIVRVKNGIEEDNAAKVPPKENA